MRDSNYVLVSTVRGKYWSTNAQNLARKRKLRPVLSPFQCIDIDLCGPFQVKYPQRSARPVKCFVVVFVCLVTKTVHLELVAGFPSFPQTVHVLTCETIANHVRQRQKFRRD